MGRIGFYDKSMFSAEKEIDNNKILSHVLIYGLHESMEVSECVLVVYITCLLCLCQLFMQLLICIN